MAGIPGRGTAARASAAVPVESSDSVELRPHPLLEEQLTRRRDSGRLAGSEALPGCTVGPTVVLRGEMTSR